MSTPAKNPFSRVFLIEGRARPDHEPLFQSCMSAGPLTSPGGDVTSIECPSPDRYNEYVEVGEIQGEADRPSTDLQSLYQSDKESTLFRIQRTKCALDAHVHFGACTDPSAFNTFTKALVYENSRITNYATDPLGTLNQSGAAEINETADLSAGKGMVYEVLQLSFSERGADAITNPLVDVVICDIVSCGDCEDESDGCQKIYAVDDGATGSPGTSPDLIYSTDKTATVAAEDIGTLGMANAASALACVDDYIFVISNADNAGHYKLKASIGDGLGGWTRIAGYVVTGEPNDVWSVGSSAFVVGDGGYVYYVDDPTAAPVVLDAGVAADGDDLNAVHALSNEWAVAVGNDDTVIYTADRLTWAAVNPTGGGADLLCVWAINESTWLVGDNAGDLWYTNDGGTTWTEKVLPGANWTEVQGIAFATRNIGYITADKSGTPRGFVLRTYDGGYSWNVMPKSGIMPNSDSLVAVAACAHDVNFVVAVGEADALGDGIMIAGLD